MANVLLPMNTIIMQYGVIGEDNLPTCLTVANCPSVHHFPDHVWRNLLRYDSIVDSWAAHCLYYSQELNRPACCADVLNLRDGPCCLPDLDTRFKICRALYGQAFVGFYQRAFF